MTFLKPERAIFTEADLKHFHKSNSYNSLRYFVKLLNESVKGKRISDEYLISDRIKATVALLDQLNDALDQFPPIDQPMRFGNKAFRSWHEQLVTNVKTMHETLLPSELHPAIIELQAYFLDSFGNYTRIDYGTGHETSFILWLYGLHKLEYFTEHDLTATVLQVFSRYLTLMQRMQTYYMLEPAGSHGVWGLDDYQCLVFYFGSSQLIAQHTISPNGIHDEEILNTCASDYLYLRAIAFIRKVKQGSPFAETSPMLNDISGVPSWEKINGGMLKLYDGEVLAKLPVIQHLVFGSIFPCTWSHSKLNTKQAIAHPNVSHPVDIHKPNFDLPGATAKAPWVDPEALEHIPDNLKEEKNA